MKSSKSSLFLMELIIAILFFALASAVCIQLFVKAHLLGKTTTVENKALLMCQNFSEIYLGILPEQYNVPPEEMKEYLLSIVKEDPAFTGIIDYSDKYKDTFSKDCVFALLLSYNVGWTACAPDESCYQIIFTYEGYDTKTDVYDASTYAYQVKQADGITLEILDENSIEIYDKNDEKIYHEIYHLNISKHIPERMQ